MKWIDLPPVWLAGFLAVAWATGADWGPVAQPLSRGGGVVLAFSGAILMAAAAWRMWRHRTTIVPRQDPSALVTGGVFGLSRNPIYLADALILAGGSLWAGSLVGLLSIPLFGFVIQRRFILGEEARLAARFGPDFDAYAARVRRWL